MQILYKLQTDLKISGRLRTEHPCPLPQSDGVGMRGLREVTRSCGVALTGDMRAPYKEARERAPSIASTV